MAVLTPLTDPYASVRVAVYEPMVTAWWSVPGMDAILTNILLRAVPSRTSAIPGGASAPSIYRFDWVPLPAGAHQPEPRPGEPVPGVVRSSARALGLPPAEEKRRADIIEKLRRSPIITPDELLAALDEAGLPHILSRGGLHATLSPIGIAHLFRQLYFDAGSGTGPVEHAFTLAPLEQLEVIQEVTRRESSERTEVFGTESTLEKQAEQTTTEEISDQVQSNMRRDIQVGVSATASANFGVWGGSSTASLNYEQSREHARETASTRSTTETKRASEIIRKTYSLTVKTFSELNERSTIKRVIRNDGPVPVNYGLRRVMRTILVKLQALGPRLVWQTHIREPGAQLALSKMVMFRDADSLAPTTAPTAPPRPVGGIETGSQKVRVLRTTTPAFFTVTIPQDPLRRILGLTINSVTDTDPTDEERPPGVPVATSTGEPVLGPDGQPVAVAFRFPVVGDGWALEVEYSLVYEPSAEALSQWEEQVRAAQAAWDAQKADEAIERARRLITAKSRIRPRPAADLRDEERYEILGRFIANSFGHLPPSGLPAPAEMELFQRYFETSALFYWVHPSWWVPRHSVNRGEYEVTDDSEPAPFGRSLGWLIQLDGDRRRNEFLNSPWIRACLPLRPGVEREALQWLAERVEGTNGFSLAAETPLASLLAAVEAQREQERLGAPGPDFVTLDGDIPPGREESVTAYPVVDEFTVTVPTEGFIYEILTTA